MNTAKSKLKPTISRKAKVKELFAAQGVEAAHTLGLKLKLKQSTLRTWCAAWRRQGLNAPIAKGKVTSNKSKAAPKAKTEVKKNGNGEAEAVNGIINL